MSTKPDPTDVGCFLWSGIICCSIAVGFISGSAYGWLAFGIALIIIALIGIAAS